MSLRFRNGRLVHRNGLLVPSCNECPPCVFVPPDPCPDSIVDFNINESGTLSIDKTYSWPFALGSVVTDEVVFERTFRLDFGNSPTVRFDLEFIVTEWLTKISLDNRISARFRFFRISPTRLNLKTFSGGIVNDSFSAFRATRTGGGVQQTKMLPQKMQGLDLETVAVTPTDLQTGNVTFQSASTSFVFDAVESEFNANPPVKANQSFGYNCFTTFVVQVAIDVRLAQAITANGFENDEPVIKASLPYTISTIY